MAKKTQKQTIYETLGKCIETCNYLVVPVAGVAAIWGFDISVYCAAGFGALASVLTFVQLFYKDK